VVEVLFPADEWWVVAERDPVVVEVGDPDAARLTEVMWRDAW
jgi:hypothetical protein